MEVNQAQLARAIPDDALLLIDTNVLIAYLAGGQAITQAATLLLDTWVHAGRNRAIVSAISVMELLVGPLRAGRNNVEILDFLTSFPNLGIAPLDLNSAISAAELRARYGLASPDALILGTAVSREADAIVSNDRAWTKVGLPVIMLGDF